MQQCSLDIGWEGCEAGGCVDGRIENHGRPDERDRPETWEVLLS